MYRGIRHEDAPEARATATAGAAPSTREGAQPWTDADVRKTFAVAQEARIGGPKASRLLRQSIVARGARFSSFAVSAPAEVAQWFTVFTQGGRVQLRADRLPLVRAFGGTCAAFFENVCCSVEKIACSQRIEHLHARWHNAAKSSRGVSEGSILVRRQLCLLYTSPSPRDRG